MTSRRRIPSVMTCELFPMSKGEKIDIKTKRDFYYNIDNYCCVFEVRFTGFISRVMFDNPISASKCRNLKNAVLNNGRVVSADSFTISMTNVDFRIYERFYKWKSATIGTFYRYKADYLPTEFVDSILTFYEDKTKLKNVENMEAEYLHQKENCNSCYGMTVTDILRAMHNMDGNYWIVDKDNKGVQPTTGMTDKEIETMLTENKGYKISLWYLSEGDRQKQIDKYNTNPQRFLFYTWGLFVTSYARANILSGVLACGVDYVYSDTDSLKILNYDKHLDYFKQYNEYISKRLEKACVYHGFDPARIRPKTIKGVEKPLGVWDDETAKIINHGSTPNGVYPLFKTVGAKRYLYLENDKLHVTIAGSNKEQTAEYLQNKYGKYYAFYKFTNDMCIPAGVSGRMASYYIEEETSGEVVDYLGNKGEFHELSSVHVEQTEYNLSITDAYMKYFLGVQQDGDCEP